MSRWRIALVVLVAAALAPRPSPAGSWVRVHSPHFVVSGNVGEKQVRQVAARLEQFREVLVRLFPGTRLDVRPLFVVAFDGERSFKPYKPVRNGTPLPVAGYFARGGQGSCIVLQLDRGEESYPIIFHEYAHLFLSQAAREMPLWLGEGLAEYYSTVEVFADGRQVNVARPVVHHVQRLRARFLPLRELLTSTQDSKIWNDREDGALAYAESWALVHYLSSQPGGAGKIAHLVRQLAAGRPHVASFEELFGPLAATEAALKHYVGQSAYRYWRLRFEKAIDVEKEPARPMSNASVEATLAIILIRLQRFEDAEGHVSAALAASSDLAETHLALGLSRLGTGRVDESEKAFRRAVELAPGHQDAAFYWGLSLLRSPSADADRVAAARAAVAAALPQENPAADLLAMLGQLEAQGGRLAEAQATLLRALKLAPGEKTTAVALADVFGKQGRFAEARALLGPIVANRAEAEWAEIARDHLAWLSREEQRRLEQAERERLGAPAEAEAEPSSAVPLFRTTGPGEQRELGVLERIDCGPNGLVMHLKTSRGLLRFHAARFENVEFITYRQDLQGQVTCGPRTPPDAVYLTWRATASAPAGLSQVEGVAVAVEFLPK